MQATPRSRFLYLLIPLALLLLCLPFLSNPLIFDDEGFFMLGYPEQFFSSGAHLLTPRWWVYETLAATFVYAGGELRWLRLGNLFAHLGAALALYFLIRRLLLDLDRPPVQSGNAEAAAFAAASLFALHPLAIFAQGYLVQRTIVCATLFSLLSWSAFWRGLNGSRSALWMSCLCLVIGLYAKEHAVMAPAVSFGLLVLFQRSALKIRLPLREVYCALSLQAILSVIVVLQMKGIIGTAYEIMTVEVLEGEANIPANMLYPLSVLNQAGLFFKYLALWALPYSASMSIDIRDAFPVDLASWTLWAGAGLYAAYGIGSALLLLCGGRAGLLGLALLAPWLLFATELSAVRLQEPFVLYRSYLWLSLPFVAIALGLRRLSRGMLYILLAVFCLYLAALSFDRLSVLSRPLFVWDEAAQHLEKRSQQGVLGAYRIYYNRGNALLAEGALFLALADYERVLELKPNYAHAYHQQGVVYMQMKQWAAAQAMFEKAIALLPDNAKSHFGRAKALEVQGKNQEAQAALKEACALGSSSVCEKL